MKKCNKTAKKWLFAMICLLIIFSVSPFTASAEEQNDAEEKINESVEQSLSQIDLSQLDSFFQGFSYSISKGASVKQIINSIIKGENVYSFDELFASVLSFFLDDFRQILPTLATVIVLSLLLSILYGVNGDFLNKQTNQVVYFACYAVAIVLILRMLVPVIVQATKAITLLSNLLYSLFPPLLTLSSALGASNTSKLIKPQLAAFLALITGIISNVILPIFIAIIMFCVVGNISDSIKLDKLQQLFTSVGNTLLKLVFGLFIGYVTISGITLSVLDQVSIKTAKFLVSSYVPILGGYLSDGLDIALCGMVLIKNGLGVVGIIAVCYTVLVPVVKLVALQLGLRLVAAITEPIADKKMSKLLTSLAEGSKLLVVALLGVGFVFVISIMLVILCGNSGVLS